jgi:hypothetical protein
MFYAQGYDTWDSSSPEVLTLIKAAIFDALLTLLPLNSVSTLTAHNDTRLGKGFWLRHASKLPLLEQARLASTAASEFWEMLAEDIPHDSGGPQLPMLTKLIIHKYPLCDRVTMLHLCDTLIRRVEQGVPLECLDLHSCEGGKRASGAIKLLAEIVVDVRKINPGAWKFPKWDSNRDEFDDGRGGWYIDTDLDEYECGDNYGDDYDDHGGDDYDEWY